MSQDDPFALPDPNHTVIIPTQGDRGRAQSAPASFATGTNLSSAELTAEVSGMNPLVAAANALLNVVPQLRATLQHPNPSGVRDFLAQQIRQFEIRARAENIPGEKIIAARYALCTLLDETAASTPWGSSGIWARNSLLVMFHNEAWGGEKFFRLLSKLAESPAAHRDVLELMYVCLALGLEGRYRVLDNGQAQLEALRERLAQLLRTLQGEYERSLSPHWQGATAQRKTLLDALPLWVALGALGLLMLGAYFGFSYFLNSMSNPIYAQIQALRAKSTEARTPMPVLATHPRLAGLLAPEIEQGLVAVRDENNRSIITIRGDGLFAPGSATIASNYLGVLDRIAAALKTVPGRVQIIGHTDNLPIRSARFPSNWHLSQERARAVAALLMEKAPAPGRYTADGRADAEPLEPNTTAAARARNRRVDIVLIAAPSQ